MAKEKMEFRELCKVIKMVRERIGERCIKGSEKAQKVLDVCAYLCTLLGTFSFTNDANYVLSNDVGHCNGG